MDTAYSFSIGSRILEDKEGSELKSNPGQVHEPGLKTLMKFDKGRIDNHNEVKSDVGTRFEWESKRPQAVTSHQ